MSSSAERTPARTVLRESGAVVPFQLPSISADAPAAPSSRAKANAEGYATGWAQGLREARAATEGARRGAVAELDRARRDRDEAARLALAAMRAAVDQVAGTTVRTAEDLAEEVLSAAVELAEALAGATVAADLVASARAAAGRVLGDLPVNVPVTVHLNPADHAELADAGLGELAPGADVTLVADGAVERGGAVVRTAVTTIDATLTTAVARVRAELAS